MPEQWIRCVLTAKLCSDAHFGSGAGGGGINALIARDRDERPVIWASHIEGVLRDTARRLHGDKATDAFFGRCGGQQQRAVFTSMYTSAKLETHVWRSAARKVFDRAPEDESLRVVEYVPAGTQFAGQVELPESDFPVLERLVREVDVLGSGRATGAGRVDLALKKESTKSRPLTNATGRLLILLKNLDPLCITATATPDNLIPSLAFVPGRAVLGAFAAWLIAEGERDAASLLVNGAISVADALPVPNAPAVLELAEVLPAPLALKSPKPEGSAGEFPWWVEPKNAVTRRVDALRKDADERGDKLKRPADDLFVYRARRTDDKWVAFHPLRRVRLRNGRAETEQSKPSLFALEQIVERTHFLCELSGSQDDMARLADSLSPILEGCRWIRIGRAGAPVEVEQVAWSGDRQATQIVDTALLTLTSDLLVRDAYLRWITRLDERTLQSLVGEADDIRFVTTDDGRPTLEQDSVMVHGFNGTSRLWRLPAAAIRRGSVYRISGTGVARLAQMAAQGQWLGERTHEGFGRFRIDAVLPGVTDGGVASESRKFAPDADEESLAATTKVNGESWTDPVPLDANEESLAATTKQWFDSHQKLVNQTDAEQRRPPSLSQWFNIVAELEQGVTGAIQTRLEPKTDGARNWAHEDAKRLLKKLEVLPQKQQSKYAHFFVRWLRAALKAEQGKGEE